jgi:hypothetical protein
MVTQHLKTLETGELCTKRAARQPIPISALLINLVDIKAPTISRSLLLLLVLYLKQLWSNSGREGSPRSSFDLAWDGIIRDLGRERGRDAGGASLPLWRKRA